MCDNGHWKVNLLIFTLLFQLYCHVNGIIPWTTIYDALIYISIMGILIFWTEYYSISNPLPMGFEIWFPLIFQLNKLNQILSAYINILVSCNTAYFYHLLGGRNFEVSSLILTKSSGFLDPSATESLRKVIQRGEPDKINFLWGKGKRNTASASCLQNYSYTIPSFTLNKWTHQSFQKVLMKY